ncbi:MAG: hypothetical protein HeimC2_42300 [Candidatus Heimdallarchaeota archaeon LC_2]|nr:MAG: hypothetical protein HeimC2_42300 [Candidatus Heimdallarchaeota archaeon LC_2]
MEISFSDGGSKGLETLFDDLSKQEQAISEDEQDLLNDIYNAGRLIRLSLSSSSKHKKEYRETIKRLRSKRPRVERMVHQIASSLDLEVLTITGSQLVLHPLPDSAFRTRAADLDLPSGLKEKRLGSLILVSIAALCFPTGNQIEDPDMRGFPVTIEEIIDKINQVSKELDKQLDTYELSPPTNHIELTKVYQEFRKYKTEIPEENKMYTQKEMVRRYFRYLIQHGFLVLDDDRYFPTLLFKLQVTALIKNKLFLDFLNLQEEINARS